MNDQKDKTRYTEERPLQLWDDQTGERYEIGPDRDGLDLVELRFYDAAGKVLNRFTMPREVWNRISTWDD